MLNFKSCVNHELKHACSNLIKNLLEITLFDFMFTTCGSNDCVLLDKSGNNMQCFQTNFSSASVSY